MTTAAPYRLHPDLVPLRGLVEAYAHRNPVRSLAVVGNAPLPESATRAAAVDACDVVIRVNSFVADRPGAGGCQGSRTDVVVWNRITRATPFLFENYPRRLYLLVEPMRMHGFEEVWPVSWPEDLGFVAVPNRAIARPLNELLVAEWREERVAPTTGTTAAFLALNLFPEAELVLTGFSFLDDPHQTRWEHQWGDSCPVGREHRIDAEAALVQGWIDQGRARFLR